VCDTTGRTVNYVAVKRDITARESLEAQLRQAQKMEAVGQLAGGVAHDFNNLLTGITGYAQLALKDVEEGSTVQTDLEQITGLVSKAANLTRQLLSFSRRQPLQPIVLNINSLVDEMTKLLKRLIGEDIDLVFRGADDLGQTRADPGQLEQALINLVVNARDAMPGGGKLTIETSNVLLDNAYARGHTGAKPGDHIMLAVSDTGCGMDQQTLSHVFEPFFTTKKQGKGTGLGLATVYGIAKQHEGNIWVYSEPGQGTTFKIYLPRVDAPPDEPAPQSEETHIPHGTETILVVEDEEPVRDVTVRVLENASYTVLSAGTPDQALAVFAEHADEIDLLLTDMIMPGMTGHALGDQLRGQRPSLKILYMSGYTANGIVHRGELNPDTPFLQKPFSPKGLAHKVRNMLDDQPNNNGQTVVEEDDA